MPASVLTIEQAAEDLQTTEARLWKHHRDGRLAIMYLAGSIEGGRTGSKDGRIDRQEWERFKKSITMSRNPVPEPTPESEPGRSKRGRPRATDPAPGDFMAKFNKKIGAQ